MVDTGRTLQSASEILKQNGAKKVYAIITHGMPALPAVRRLLILILFVIGLLSGEAMDKINAMPIEKLVVSRHALQVYE